MKNNQENFQAPRSFVEEYYAGDLEERESAESKWALKWFKEVRGKNVLSWGCGPNFYDDALFSPDLPEEFVGMDLNKNNIEFLKQPKHPEATRCKSALEANKTKIKLFSGDIRENRAEFINHFDTVYAVGVLGMFKESDLNNMLKLAYSYLKPGGRLIDVDWTDCRLPEEKYKERESFEWYSKQGPSIERIGELIRNNGFKILKREIHAVSDPINYGWGSIYAFAAEKILN